MNRFFHLYILVQYFAIPGIAYGITYAASN